MEANGMRTRSFRYEDYNNRRVFLRSYPLQWEGEDQKANEEMGKVTKENSGKKPIKKIILSIIHWGEGKIVVLKRFQHKLTVYVIACIPTRKKEKKLSLLPNAQTGSFHCQKNIIDTPIVKHPTATQGLKRSPISATTQFYQTVIQAKHIQLQVHKQ
ncbi:conserved hypothetical protein [Ricinus communis]|uniref:Uncharacterized protein n=1 Tax=Ricinus communis TaxID=3988 RepID=B9RMH2_RICCO|nr:conserved hypothetical protein [Ricinus communis]